MNESLKTKHICEQCGTLQEVEINQIHLTEEDHEQLEQFGCIYGECQNCC